MVPTFSEHLESLSNTINTVAKISEILQNIHVRVTHFSKRKDACLSRFAGLRIPRLQFAEH